MKQTFFFIVFFAVVINTALSQTNTEKYFLHDSISITSEHCSKTIVKKKETISCYTKYNITRINNKTFIENTAWANSRGSAIVTTGNLLQVDFIMSTIIKETNNGKDALPVVSYVLKLEGQNGKSPFTQTNKFTKPAITNLLYIPFTTYRDAADAKEYLESLVGIDWKKGQ